MDVSVAIITDPHHRILITQRPWHVPHGGLWEFPGGKCESWETPEQALIREIKEEVGLAVHLPHFLTTIHHDYGDKCVALWVYQVTHFVGQAACLASQLDLRWVTATELNQFVFPEANTAIISAIISDK